MARTKVFEIPGKMTVEWDSDAKAIVDTWADYGVSKEAFAEAVLQKGVVHAKTNGGKAYIVDSSRATGTFSSEIQQFIGSDIFPAFVKNGIEYFITISSDYMTTNMSIKDYSAKAGPNGLKLVEAKNLSAAVAFMRDNPQ
jgi:hypothetical protein